MKHLIRLLIALIFPSAIIIRASAFVNMDFVPVGNPNGSDLRGVDYNYSIGKYEVTLNQYAAFLNAVATTDTYGLYNVGMGSDPLVQGIARNTTAAGYSYSVIENGNRPVTYVSWFDAARFANWMHNGQPIGTQDATTTERGAYTLDGALTGLIARNTAWAYGLPSGNEWYKAAYYQPASQGGDTDNYWLYPTQSNTQPNSRNGSNVDSNSANYYFDDGIANGFNGGYAVNNSTSIPTENALTDVGAFSLADGYYGTFDQGGNVSEWTDMVILGRRSSQGGSWFERNLQSTAGSISDPSFESNHRGFRLVLVPEPNAFGIIVVGMIIVARKWKRSHRS